MSDDAVVLDIDGLPAARVPIHVDLRSQSGKTSFKTRSGDCSVKASSKRRATCVAGSGSGRTAVLLLAPKHFQAVIPLDYPDTLTSDELSVSISIPGYDDPSRGNNTRTFTFTPKAKPSPSPTPEPPPTPEPDPEADLHLTLSRLDDTRLRASVTGLPAGKTNLRFELTLPAEVKLDTSPDGCTPSSGVVNCNGVTGSFQGDFTFGYPATQAPIDVTVAVSAAGVDETAPADNTRTVRLREVPPTVLTLALVRLDISSIFDAGQFQAIVSWPVAAADPARIRFHDIVTTPATGFHHGPPAGCAAQGADFVCTVDDSDGDNTWVADRFDLDMTAFVLLQPVNVAMKVSVEPSNGTAAGADTECLAWPLSLC